jgi:hypothetical protein
MDDQNADAQMPRNPARVLAFIRSYFRAHSIPPTVHEIQSGLDISTSALALYYVRFLERAGYIRRQRGLVRNIALIENTAVVPSATRETPGIPVPEADKAGPSRRVVKMFESIFPYGNDGLCDICGRNQKDSEERFCAPCRTWLTKFELGTRPAGAALDMARCLAMMLRYGERPDGTGIKTRG